MDKNILDFLVTKFYQKDFDKQQKDLDKAVKKEDKSEIINIKKKLVDIKQKAKIELYPWLLNSSIRANQLSITTHPPKFSHPDAKIDAIIANNKQSNDGLLRTGNVKVDLDVMGNAASFDVDRFLRLKMDNDLTILQNLEQNTNYIKEQFKVIKDGEYNKIRDDFLKIKKSGISDRSSDKIKQIYFPVNNEYHLLSLLTPSGILYKLKQEINKNYQPFSKLNKNAKEQLAQVLKENKKLEDNLENKEFECKLENIWNLTSVGYGGTKPQNISVLNSKNMGVSYLLSSMPPILEKRKVQPPKKNFFSTGIWLNKSLETDFKELNSFLNNKNEELRIKEERLAEGKLYQSIREIRDEFIVFNIMSKIKQEIDKVREISPGWSDSNTYAKLPKWQKILLDNKYEEQRKNNEENQDFLEKSSLEFSKWFVLNYKTLFKTTLGDVETTHINNLANKEMEVFK